LKKLWLLLLLGGCTTVENDPSTNFKIPLLRTQIDFQPPDSGERIRLIARETKIYEKRLAELEDRQGGLDAKREILFQEISQFFPECKRQRHCLAAVAKGTTARFERYQEISKSLVELDRQVVVVDSELALWKRRYELRVRSLYNRYLAHELLRLPDLNPKIRQITAHSLEALPDRRSITYRLLQLADPLFVPEVVGDLQFRMMNRPVDQAAILATFDVRLEEKTSGSAPNRYLVTFLINTYQQDPQFYEKDFLREWSRLLSEPGQAELKRQTFCGIYSLAGPTLAPKLSVAKAKNCAETRLRHETVQEGKFDDRFEPSNWIIPLTFTRADAR
jgi:hypothetical protein